MRLIAGFFAVAALAVLCMMAACQRTESADKDYAPGAFPPTLSATDYHKNSWSRTDCLTCHESGVENAPKMKHLSVVDLAKESKCRTCHVTVAGP